MAHIKALEKGTAKYPIRPVDCKVYSIPQAHAREPVPRDAAEATNILVHRQQCLQRRIL